MSETREEDPRRVKPPSLPRYPQIAKCPQCGYGGMDGDPTVISYESASDGRRYVSCGYCYRETLETE